MLVILAGGPVTAPVEAGLGEEAEAEVVMVFPASHSVSAVVSGGVLLSLLPHDVSMMVQSTRHISFLMLLVSLPGELLRDVDSVHADGVRLVSIMRDGPELIGVVRYVE